MSSLTVILPFDAIIYAIEKALLKMLRKQQKFNFLHFTSYEYSDNVICVLDG